MCIGAEFCTSSDRSIFQRETCSNRRALVDRIVTGISRPACLNVIERLCIGLLLINEQNIAIEFDSKERKGVAMTYRNIASRISYGTPEAPPLKRPIEEDIRSAQELDGRYRKDLKITHRLAGFVEMRSISWQERSTGCKNLYKAAN